jgi:hypothetical protein
MKLALVHVAKLQLVVKEAGFYLCHMILTQPLCVIEGESRAIENFSMLQLFFSDHSHTNIIFKIFRIIARVFHQ